MARNGGQRKKGEKRALLWTAVEAEAVGKKLIEKVPQHSHLKGRRVVYAFQKKNPKQAGKVVLGTAQIIGGKAAALEAGLPSSDVVIEAEERFFLITIGFGGWSNLTKSQKEALVDHELCHCGLNEKGNLYMVPHDIQEFKGVVDRHGLYLGDLEEFAESCAAAQQPKLPLEEAGLEVVSGGKAGSNGSNGHRKPQKVGEVLREALDDAEKVEAA